MDNGYENQVINFLGTNQKSTSEITSEISRDYYFVLKLLEGMEDKGLVEKISLGRFTYWKLTEKTISELGEKDGNN